MTTSITAAQRTRTSLDLPRGASACPRARSWTADVLTRWDATSEESDDVVLVMCELVTNAIVHATGPVRAHLRRDQAGCYHVQVDDGGPADRPDRPARHDDEHGRGLVIVGHLATRHGRGHAPHPYRSRAWAVLSPGASPSSTPAPTSATSPARTLEPTT